MDNITLDNRSEKEILDLAERGVDCYCPVCSSILKPFPLTWKSGVKLNGLTCLNSDSHFLVYGDDATKFDIFNSWINRV